MWSEKTRSRGTRSIEKVSSIPVEKKNTKKLYHSTNATSILRHIRPGTKIQIVCSPANRLDLVPTTEPTHIQVHMQVGTRYGTYMRRCSLPLLNMGAVSDGFVNLWQKFCSQKFLKTTKLWIKVLTACQSHYRTWVLFFFGGLGRCSHDHLDLEVYCDVALC